MRRGIAALLGLALAACGGGTTAPTTPTTAATTTTMPATTTFAGFEVTSDDGDVTVRVPFEALAEDPGIAITRLSVADYPAAFAGVLGADDAVYSLTPDGLVFDAPVTVTARLHGFEALTDTEIPLVTMVSANDAGTELLSDLAVTRIGDEVFASGTTTHFSAFGIANEQVVLEVKFVEATTDFATEIGVDLTLTPQFHNTPGVQLQPPAALQPQGSAGQATFVPANGSDLVMQCTRAKRALADVEIPLVTMVSANEAGTELLSDLAVTRIGDEVFATGTTTHFSAFGVANEQVVLEVKFVEATTDFATEIGVDLTMTPQFHDTQGVQLQLPAVFQPQGSGGPATFVPANSSDLVMQCTRAEQGLADVHWDAVVTAPTLPNAVGLTFTPQIVELAAGGVGVRMGIKANVNCIDPATVLTGRPVRFQVKIDHPGGTVIVPGENFNGGLSGAAGTIGGSALDAVWVGLITDVDGNGQIDPTDTMFPPYPTTASGGELGFVLPLYGFAKYFVYVVSPPAFGDLATISPDPVSVVAGTLVLGGLFRGPGRVESSVGVVGSGGAPTTIVVGAGETTQSSDAELLIFITPRLVTTGE